MSNRSYPVGRVEALRRILPEPGPCTTVSCIESVTEPARPAARHFMHLLLSIARLPQSHAALGESDVGRRLRTRLHRADGRAPARGEPVLAGVPWACDGEMRERGHGIRQYEANRERVAAERPKTTNRAADDRPTQFRRGWANVHAGGVVRRLVNIGTRLPGRAL